MPTGAEDARLAQSVRASSLHLEGRGFESLTAHWYSRYMERLEALVSGHVQGVMFRDFARRLARARGIAGEAENLPDDTLRVIAEGDRASLEALLDKLR